MAGITEKIKDLVMKTNFLVSKSKEQHDKSDEMLRIEELWWRDIFVDTVKGYTWYHDKSLSLGRWAIGYNYAYVLARVLDELKPTDILECGLGQSSKIITDYVSVNSGVNYDIVEQDQNWIDFLRKIIALKIKQIYMLKILSRPIFLWERGTMQKRICIKGLVKLWKGKDMLLFR